MQQRRRLAVLIDGENISGAIADGLFAEIAKLGDASVRRVYGDFSAPHLKPWACVLSRHAILAHQSSANIPGKNASDIALAIDAMDLLHSGRFDGLCLVSSDSDFTRLAMRIREEGIDAFGFGESKTPESFRKACRQFFFTESLCTGAATESGRSASRSPEKALPFLETAMTQIQSKNGWAELSALERRVTELAPGFKPSNYGYARLHKLVHDTEQFELDKPEGRGMRVRLKTMPKPGAKR